MRRWRFFYLDFRRCCACRGMLSSDAFCRRRSCGLFMADADEIGQLTFRSRFQLYSPLRYIRQTAHLLTAKRIAKIF